MLWEPTIRHQAVLHNPRFAARIAIPLPITAQDTATRQRKQLLATAMTAALRRIPAVHTRRAEVLHPPARPPQEDILPEVAVLLRLDLPLARAIRVQPHPGTRRLPVRRPVPHRARLTTAVDLIPTSASSQARADFFTCSGFLLAEALYIVSLGCS